MTEESGGRRVHVGLTFRSADAARTWLSEHGFSVGLDQHDAPAGIVWGRCIISTWCNLSPWDRVALDGLLTRTSDGLYTVDIFAGSLHNSAHMAITEWLNNNPATKTEG